MAELGERVTRVEERLDALCKSLERRLSEDEGHELRLRKLENETVILKAEHREIEDLKKRVKTLEGKVRRNTLYLSVAQVILALLGKFIPADFVIGG